jgi:hypothetical protein
VKIDKRLSLQVRTLFEAAARGDEVIIEREGQPALRLMLESDYLALVGPREPLSEPEPTDTPVAPAEAPAADAPRPTVPKVPPATSMGPPLNDQLAAEELVASIAADKVGWEPWWKCTLAVVTVTYPDLAQLELEARVATAYGWRRASAAEELPKLRGGFAVRLGLAPRRAPPNLTVTWARSA